MKHVLVVGAPRSGTTWIGKVLAATSGSTYVHEPDGTAEPFAFAAKLTLPMTPVLHGEEDLRDYERLWSGAFAGGRRAGTLRDQLARRLYATITAEEKRRARHDGDLSWRVRLSRAAAVPLVADPAHRTAVVKSVHVPLALEWLSQRFDPAVLVVLRHPYNVLASRLEMSFSPGSLDLRAAAKYAAQAWGVEPVRLDDPALLQMAFHLGTVLLAMSDALDRHPTWHSVRHEDLCVEPAAGFRDVATRLGLEWTDEAESLLQASNRRGSGYDTNRVAKEQPDRWRERLRPDQVTMIDEALARFPKRLMSAFTSPNR